ncbi:MAG: hypothetical protein V2I46_02685 [Bacteroides sp.]|jgi:hypothetical protein|nr:hypothetical protein [Bacteroides sp.]
MEHHHLIEHATAIFFINRQIWVMATIAFNGMGHLTSRTMLHFKAHHIAVVMVWNHSMHQEQYIGQGGKQYGRQVFGHINPFVAAKVILKLVISYKTFAE